ncbi:hypothetical protein SAMN04488057_11930 [Cyclobacterium lianum]|uniref:Mannosyltransferase n=1 Tax=Cyclobacterium lianum TaxID=388280 RepID=A0A1M7QKI4_9BACT|nr:hypothetical protein SAMN04488057_11930 [Cyclobacterium lianum]
MTGISLGLLGMGYWFPRTAFQELLGLYALAFACYLYLVSIHKKSGLSPFLVVILAMGLRLLLLAAIPGLSDDFYRYLFDGQLLLQGINPYQEIPVLVNAIPENDYWHTLLENMNSPRYYSLYPPLHQFFFWLAALPGEHVFYNVLALRICLLLGEGINLWLMQKLLFHWRMPAHQLSWYAFNPLVIMELTGNLHFEGLVLTGLLLTIYCFGRSNVAGSGLSWASSIAIKLNPLILAPVWIRFWDSKQFWNFFLTASFFVFLLLSPVFFFGGAKNFYQSFRLYQSTFEFNASIYYLIRWLASSFVDYNPIAYLGPFLNLLAALLLLWMGLYQRTFTGDALARKMVWMYLVFLLLQTTIHPWYLIPALGLSVLTPNRSFVVWSGLVFLSYQAYAQPGYTENLWIVAVEYILLGLAVGLFAYREHMYQNSLSGGRVSKR